jgi:hypothetical protein
MIELRFRFDAAPCASWVQPGPRRGGRAPAGELFDEMNAYGAVLAGRRTAEQIDHWWR